MRTVKILMPVPSEFYPKGEGGLILRGLYMFGVSLIIFSFLTSFDGLDRHGQALFGLIVAIFATIARKLVGPSADWWVYDGAYQDQQRRVSTMLSGLALPLLEEPQWSRTGRLDLIVQFADTPISLHISKENLLRRQALKGEKYPMLPQPPAGSHEELAKKMPEGSIAWLGPDQLDGVPQVIRFPVVLVHQTKVLMNGTIVWGDTVTILEPMVESRAFENCAHPSLDGATQTC